jgi:ATP-dependent Lhr-like helicase
VQPPDVLVTTPESLALMLSQVAWADVFRDLRWVVVDEIHAIAGNKRGADLALSLERLADFAGEVQRIGLSATCRPLAEAACFLAGANRPCAVAEVAEPWSLQLAIEPLPPGGAFLSRLVERLGPELTANRTTLVFTNVRSLAERLTWTLRRHFPAWAEQIGVHHSSLDAARRRRVELQLKRGRLRAVVSSTSLELGIDIGSVDGVVLVHPPGGVVRLRQRLGRAGHGPGRPQRGLVLTATVAELLEAAVTAAAGQAALYEPLRAPAAPLDVLCQQILGMAAQRPWMPDEAFALVRRAYPYRTLERADFDECLDYLFGSQQDGRAWLPARLHWDGEHFAIADRRTRRILWQNLGTIVADEVRPVLEEVADAGRQTNRQVGTVDEAFADRLQPGDRFLLDGRCLEYRGGDGPALLVQEIAPGLPRAPRWAGNAWNISADLAQRQYELRLRAAENLCDGVPALVRFLRQEYGLDGRAARMLADYFQRQEWVSEIPDAGTCLVEIVADEAAVDYYLHTPLNRAGNDALARVVVHRLARDHGQVAVSMVADLGFQLAFRRPVELSPEDFRALLRAENFADDLAGALADSDLLRERFRCAALTGLMLLRNPLGGRRRVGGPDWAQRRLFEKVRDQHPGFVLLRQARRDVGETALDAAAALGYLQDLPRRRLHGRRLPQVSPFAESWTQQHISAVGQVESPADALRRLHAALWEEDPHARSPALAADAAAGGRAPADGDGRPRGPAPGL